MKTLVIGLGNPILGDDGVGWRVAEVVAKAMAGHPEVEVDCFSLGGLSLMERLTDYETVVLIDAIFTGVNKVGSVSQFTLDNLPEVNAGHTTAAHDTTLRNALNVGRSMGISLPRDEDISIVAIEAENVYDFSEALTPPIEAAVPLAAQAVLNVIKTCQQMTPKSDHHS